MLRRVLSKGELDEDTPEGSPKEEKKKGRTYSTIEISVPQPKVVVDNNNNTINNNTNNTNTNNNNNNTINSTTSPRSQANPSSPTATRVVQQHHQQQQQPSSPKAIHQQQPPSSPKAIPSDGSTSPSFTVSSSAPSFSSSPGAWSKGQHLGTIHREYSSPELQKSDSDSEKSVSSFKTARPSHEKEFSVKDVANMDLSTLSTAKLDMVFKRVMNEMGIPDVSRQSILAMSNADKIAMIEIPPQKAMVQPAETSDLPPMPDLEELNRVFVILLHELGIPAERQQMMMMLPASKKWMLITQHKDRLAKPELSAKALEKDTSSPRYYITLLESRMISKDDITHLRVSLSSRPIPWIREFIQLGGVPLLSLNIKDKILKEQKSGTDVVMELEILAIFKALMNVNDGMETIVQRADVSSTLIQLLTSPDMKIKSLLVEIFAVICAVSSKGYRQVIIAFKLLKEVHKEEKRFSTLVKSLTFTNSTPDYLVGAMTLINCIVNIPEEVSSRIRMRNEFLQLGILNIIKTLRGHSNDYLMVQLDVFEDEMERDAQEIKSKGGSLLPITEEDPTKIFSVLKQSASNTPHYQAFLQTMQYFLDFTVDVAHGPKIWETFKSLAVQYLQMRDSQELLEEDEVALCPKNTAQYSKMKIEYTRQIDAMGKMLQATVQQVTSMKRDREEKNKIIAMLMTQVKDADYPGAPPLVQGAEKGTLSKLFARKKRQSEVAYNPYSPKTVHNPLQLQLDELQAKYTKLLDDYEELKSRGAGESSITGAASEDGKGGIGGSGGIGGIVGSGSVGIGGTGLGIGGINGESSTGPPLSPPVEVAEGDVPPPPPMPGGPPPPPPPPPPGGKKGAAKPVMPQKPVITPAVKMKQVNWGKLNYAQAEQTVWAKLDDAHVSLDADLVEMMFGAKVVVKQEAASTSKKPAFITLIDPKKANNTSIMLTKFKMFTFAQIREAILTLDESILDEEAAGSLLRFAPVKEDLEAIQGYEGDIAQLGKTEQFYIEINKVPRLVPRLRCICFKLTFYKILNDIKPDVDAVVKATEELQNSKKLYKLFEYILAVGNYLNGGSARGGAFGFRIDGLLKLRDTKSNDPMVPSMLHFIASLVESKNPEVLEFHKELSHVEHAAKVNTGVVISQLATLRKGIEEAEREATAAPISTEVDCFKNVINAFLISAKSDFKEVDEKIAKMDEMFKVVAKLYGESTAKPEELFNIFANFTDSFLRAKDENVKKREAAAKAAAKKKTQMEAAAARAKAKLEGAELAAKPLPAIPGLEEEITAVRAESPVIMSPAAVLNEDERGGMDNMLAALRSGSAFRRQAV